MKRTMWAIGLVCGTVAMMAGAALAAGIDGTGLVGTCAVSGQIQLKPALVNNGTTPGTVKTKSASSGACSGGTMDGATVASFKTKGAGTTTSNACGNLIGSSASTLTLSVKWKVTPGSQKLNPSTISFTTQTGGLTMDNMHGTFDITGTVTAGSFIGNPVTAHIETDQTIADLGTACAGKGIKKITFGLSNEPSSCMNGPDLHAAITAQITTIDGSDVPHLQVEILTVTTLPFQLTATDVPTHPAGMVLESISSTCAASGAHYRCTHEAFFISTGACRWNGDYVMNLSYACNPTNTCDLCNGTASIPFSLASEDFCSSNTNFCVADLSCAEAAAGNSSGGVPCCSNTYFPLISCLSQHCASECADAIAATGGIVPSSSCYTCVFANCHDPYFACSADNADCFTNP